jgi:hypothetical protein
MKRIICILLVAVLAVSAPLLLLAAKKDTLTNNGSSSSDAYATHIGGNPNVVTAKPDKNGNFAAQKDGETVAVDPVGDHSKHKLVVRFFNPADKDAIKWMDETTGGLSDGFMPFEAFYLDKKGNRVELEKGDKITINLTSTDVLIKCVAPDGSVVDLPFTVDGNKITFEAPGGKFCYYAVVTKVPTQPSAPGGTVTEPTNPDTGILFDEVSWMAIMGLSGSALAILLLIRKRQLDLEY